MPGRNRRFLVRTLLAFVAGLCSLPLVAQTTVPGQMTPQEPSSAIANDAASSSKSASTPLLANSNVRLGTVSYTHLSRHPT